MTTTDLSPRPEDALADLASQLREEGPVVSEHVAESDAVPAVGMLVAAGPRCASDPGAYAAVVELVREGYLCHYREPRLLGRLDPDLRLLVGDHLYARGIERLARLGDLLAVTELSDLISTAAQLDAAPEADPDAQEVAWLAAAVTIAAGPSEELAAAKEGLRRDGDPAPLWKATEERAERAGLSEQLSRASESVGFATPNRG
ncbi:MAG: hypothetical protein U0R51_01295 [Solirubrobacterales bacterium]